MKKEHHGRTGSSSAEIPIADFGDGEIYSSNAQPPLRQAKHAERLNMDNANALDKQVNELAYMLWLKRGCPMGSPEVDWFRAERTVRLQADRIV